MEDVPEEVIGEAERWMAQSIAGPQRADRVYWKNIISELRDFRRRHRLVEDQGLWC